MEITCVLSERKGNPEFPRNIGDSIKVEVEFPLMEEFYDLISSIHDSTFILKSKSKEWQCVLNQGLTPITMAFPDKESSGPIVQMKLGVWCDLEDVALIKRTEQLKLII